jgi:aspartate racemase
MKIIGLLGGLGPESTKQYYEELVNLYLERSKGQYPEIIIYSVNMEQCRSYLEKDDLHSLTGLLSDAVHSLVSAGADFVAMASNSPHIVFNELQRKAKVPMISIVEESAGYASRVSKNRKAGLLGTRFTMQAGFFHDTFRKYGIELYVPSEEDQHYIHEKIFSELAAGQVKRETKKRFYDIVDSMVKDTSMDSLILGCTELPLVFDRPSDTVNYINNNEIHINSIMDYCLRDNDNV